MSVYTTVTQAELESWLAQYTPGQLVELKGIAAGITNTTTLSPPRRAAMC